MNISYQLCKHWIAIISFSMAAILIKCRSEESVFHAQHKIFSLICTLDWDPDYRQYRGLEGNIDAALFVPTTNCAPLCTGNTFFFSVSKILLIKNLTKTVDFFSKTDTKILSTVSHKSPEKWSLHFETDLSRGFKIRGFKHYKRCQCMSFSFIQRSYVYYQIGTPGTSGLLQRQPISQVFQGLPNHIDAATLWTKNDKAFFFKGKSLFMNKGICQTWMNTWQNIWKFPSKLHHRFHYPCSNFTGVYLFTAGGVGVPLTRGSGWCLWPWGWGGGQGGLPFYTEESAIFQKIGYPRIWKYGQCAVDTHHTGMHSCFLSFYKMLHHGTHALSLVYKSTERCHPIVPANHMYRETVALFIKFLEHG